MSISFHSLYPAKYLPNKNSLRKWLNAIIKEYGRSAGELNFIFVSDEYLLGINQEYLHHDFYTDIITFNYNDGQIIQGDIYISIERVTENAGKYHTTIQEELLRVMAHGILHLLGYGDEDDREKCIMRKLEDNAIKNFLSE